MFVSANKREAKPIWQLLRIVRRETPSAAKRRRNVGTVSVNILARAGIVGIGELKSKAAWIARWTLSFRLGAPSCERVISNGRILRISGSSRYSVCCAPVLNLFSYGCSRNDISLNIFWQVSNRLQMTASYGIQKLAYTGGQGSSVSNSLVFALQGKPFGGKLDFQVNWSLLKTKSAFNFASTGTTTTTTPTSLTDTSTDLNSLGFEVDYPLSSRQTLFARSLIGTTSGYLGNTESNMSVGMRYGITRAMAFELGWQVQQHTYKDAQNASLNYKASSILANLGFHF